MMKFYFSPAYENWAAAAARIIFGLVFLMGAFFKIPGTDSFAMQVEMSGAVGIPLPLVAVTLAFILELVGGVALVIGWQTRLAALALAAFVMLVAFFFYRNIGADQTVFAGFMSCVIQSAGLLYISVYGAQYAALAKDPLPQHVKRI